MAKYIVTRSDGVPIPEDEPCLVVRAQDVFAPAVLRHYMDMTRELVPAHVTSALERHWQRLMAWRDDNEDRIKVPD